jgi:hypothetical protein
MPRKFAVYKGLQKPLVFKGFQGKFIYWGLVSGALLMSLVSMWLGAVVLISCILGGLLFTAHKQKGGLHSKRRDTQIFILNHYGRKKLI